MTMPPTIIESISIRYGKPVPSTDQERITLSQPASSVETVISLPLWQSKIQSSIDHVPYDAEISQVSTEQLRQKESDWAQQVEKRFRLKFWSLLHKD